MKIIHECSGAVLGSKSYHAATLQMVLLFCQDCAVYANIFADNAFCPNDIINSSGISEVVPLPQYLMRGKRRRRKYTWPWSEGWSEQICRVRARLQSGWTAGEAKIWYKLSSGKPSMCSLNPACLGQAVWYHTVESIILVWQLKTCEIHSVRKPTLLLYVLWDRGASLTLCVFLLLIDLHLLALASCLAEARYKSRNDAETMEEH